MKTRNFRILTMTVAFGALTACAPGGGLDWDMRGITGGGLDTSGAARQATQQRPRPDDRGVLSYPGYQVVLARRGDTVRSVAARLGIDAEELGRNNALKPDDLLRNEEVLALPRRIDAAPAGGTAGAIVGGTIAPAPVDVTTLATGALDRAGGPGAAKPAAPSGPQPARHQVKRGETAYSIARSYNVSVKALAEWNSLGTDLSLREGQYLLIPVTAAISGPTTEPLTSPGSGTPTPVPPSAAKPLPNEKTAPSSSKPKDTPSSPNLGEDRSTASTSKYAMPVDGRIIRGYSKGKNDGIDIAAAAGTPVKAAAGGVVAAITKDTDQVPILVLRHDGNVLTVYAGIEAVKVKKGDKVSRGQTVAVVRKANPAFVHFEVRKGVDSVDPMSLLQ